MKNPTRCCHLTTMGSTYLTFITTCFLILMASNHVHSQLFSKVTVNILPKDTVMEATQIQIDCDYEPTSAAANSVLFTADTNAVYSYTKSPTPANEAKGIFKDRATLTLPATAGKFRVTVSKVTTKDKLSLQCQVFGVNPIQDNKLSLAKTFTVNAIPKLISFTSSPKLPVVEKVAVTLFCKVNLGNPGGTIKWTKNVKGVPTTLTGVKQSETDNGDNTKTRIEKYVIANPQAVESGTVYKCEVDNDARTTEKKPEDSITLIVQYPPRNIKFSDANDIVVAGKDITCTAEGNPTPTITWVRVSGMQLRSSGEKLHVPTSTYNGTYKYDCYANNTINGQDHTISKYREFTVFGSCSILTWKPKVYFTENETASIMCQIKGSERPIWSKEGAKKTFDCESFDSDYTVSCVKQKFYNLTFTPDWSYRGKYSCACYLEKKYVEVGINVIPRSIKTSCKINVGGEDEKVCIDTQINSNDNLTITTEVSCAHPVPTLSWKIGDKALNITSFDPVTLQTACSHGAFKGQTSVSQVFHARWEELSMAQTLTLVVTNDASSIKVAVKLSETKLSTAEIAAISAGVIVAVAIIITVTVVTVKAKCAATTTTKVVAFTAD